jgi:fructokinase
MTDTWGGIEAGGTKFVCMAGNSPDDVWAAASIPTSTPKDTFRSVLEFFREVQKIGALRGIGIASFGPIELDPTAPKYGYITTTPKQGWRNINVVGVLQTALDIPVAFDTDVNGAALGEYKWGAGKDLKNFLYLTVGTGIGGGLVINGSPLMGIGHPEMGHIRIPHDLEADPFRGNCPYHRDCFEGLASGPAIEARWGVSPSELPPDHRAWHLEANYLALALTNYIFIFSPQRIIIGGGILNMPGLLEKTRAAVMRLMGGYLGNSEMIDNIDSYIVKPQLGGRAGVLGAIALAKDRLGNLVNGTK